jgi:thioredoxin-like negative regulator of GroEL
VGIAAQPLLLFFSSARSGPCRRLESVLAHVARRQRSRLSILRVDVDEHGDVAARFGIRSLPTVVLVRDKRAVCRLDGRISAARIEAAIDEHLAAPTAA